MSEHEAYAGLVDWLNKHWFPLPEADKILPLVGAAFTPDEASLLTGIPFSAKSLDELAEMKEMDPAALREQLDDLARKGAIFRTVKGDNVRYSLSEAGFMLNRFSFWPGRDDERSMAMAPLANKYYYDAWDVFKYTHHKGLRTLPIEGTIEEKHQILPFEEVAAVLETKEYFSVTNCVCRHRKKLDPDSPTCKHSNENCLHFDRLARYSVENGMGREITREEANEILRKSAKEGLVHALSNMQEDPDTVCNCCSCCCVMFEAYHKLGHAEGMVASNYRIRVDADSCVGCNLCVKRCPMNALHLVDAPEAKDRVTAVTKADGKVKEFKNRLGKVAVLGPEPCVGCGVCAYKCSTQSLVLERLDDLTYPPKNGLEFVGLLDEDFKAGVSYLRES